MLEGKPNGAEELAYELLNIEVVATMVLVPIISCLLLAKQNEMVLPRRQVALFIKLLQFHIFPLGLSSTGLRRMRNWRSGACWLGYVGGILLECVSDVW